MVFESEARFHKNIGAFPGQIIDSFHPEMVFLANLGVNLHVCLCGDLQVASAQTLDFLDIGQKSSFPDWKLSSTGKSFPDGD
ncbi:hypothetical protein TRIP_B330543 [uncultured Desulfatiglans sp.]|nr:hypothetical protein TRIP_B330543 [uncultured Desulfatiglans sp.]